MPDQLTITNGTVSVCTEEGATWQAPQAVLDEVLAEMCRLPLGGRLLPDGVKAVFWESPYAVVVHQAPPMYRPLTWITADSPADFGPETQYRRVQLSLPYSIVMASYVQLRNSLHLTDHNELYFSPRPLRSEDDALCYPALLNVSYIDAGARVRSWICTQNLQRQRSQDWCQQLQALLNHVWCGAFNRSSERHEGQSMYQFSADAHEALHPVERWEEASRADPRFALSVPWKPAPLNVGQLARAMLAELASGAAGEMYGGHFPRRSGLVARLIRRLQKKTAPVREGATP